MCFRAWIFFFAFGRGLFGGVRSHVICVMERIYDARGVDILAWAGGLSIGTEDSWQVEQIFVCSSDG